LLNLHELQYICPHFRTIQAPLQVLNVGGFILTPNQNSLSDLHFDKLLMLKTNASVVEY